MRSLIGHLALPEDVSPIEHTLLGGVYVVIVAVLLAVCQVVLHAISVGGVPQVGWQEIAGAAVLAAASALTAYLHTLIPLPAPTPTPAPPAPPA